jgi:kynureninase
MLTSPLPDPALLDRDDPLRGLRERFELPRAPDGSAAAVYLCGNSLGPMPRAVRALLTATLDDWGTLGVRGHHEGARPWIPYAGTLAAPMAALVGAEATDVVLMNSLTVNLHLLMASFYRPTATRYAVLVEQGAFPSDLYAIDSQLRFHGQDPAAARITVAPRPDEDLLRTEDIVAQIDAHAGRLALLLLPGVQYRTGQVLDIATISAAARAVGAVVGWDLAHAVGNIPLSLAAWDIDFAVWCTYKYLCGGPGAIGGAYVARRHRAAIDVPRLAGWWGHDAATRFEMGPDFRPMPGAAGWQLSNPPILATAPLGMALALFAEAGMPALRAKSVALTGFAQAQLAARLGGEVHCITPAAAAGRGCQVSLRLRGGRERARRVFTQLGSRGVIGDWREPDVIRLAPHPLYNSFADVAAAIDILAELVACN